MLNGVSVEKLRDWLVTQGAQIQSLTNEWEVLRFKMQGVTHVVYKNKAGRLNCDDKTNRYAQLCREGVKPAKAGYSTGWARNIIKRGTGLKALLLSATTGPEHPVSCGCNVLPWESCKHTKQLSNDP